MRADSFKCISDELKTPIAPIQGTSGEGLKEGINRYPESMEFYCDKHMDDSKQDEYNG